jgi:hypothetical protein
MYGSISLLGFGFLFPRGMCINLCASMYLYVVLDVGNADTWACDLRRAAQPSSAHLKWGIATPDNLEQAFYVWFVALTVPHG